MLHLSRILISTIVLAASAVSLSACGQQGPLYLPAQPVAAQRANVPETQTTPTAARPLAPASTPAPQ